MKTFLALLISTSVFATIPQGTYQLEKIQCSTGKTMKLGGKFLVYVITLKVQETTLVMTAKAKAGSWAPFKLNCTQVNSGEYIYTAEGKYEAELPMSAVKCNAEAWTNILKKQHFGVEEYGSFTYAVSGDKLVIQNPNTVTKYSCEKTNGYPIYHYYKIN
jgi:hypothetical protein